MPITNDIEKFLDNHNGSADREVVRKYIQDSGVGNFLINEDPDEIVRYNIKARKLSGLDDLVPQGAIFHNMDLISIDLPAGLGKHQHYCARYGILHGYAL